MAEGYGSQIGCYHTKAFPSEHLDGSFTVIPLLNHEADWESDFQLMWFLKNRQVGRECTCGGG